MENDSGRRIALLILESHPVQYHAPVYREACRLAPGRIKVVYASDCSVRGYRDREFGRSFAWDQPLLEGYPVQVLNSERGEPLRGPFTLHGRDIAPLLWRERPRAVLFTQLAYEFEWVAYLCCLVLGIQIWLRVETQDEANWRSRPKNLIRSLIYRLVYAPLDRAFAIGQLNRGHLLAHGVDLRRIITSPYCVVDRLAGVSLEQKMQRRQALREQIGVGERDVLIGFFGKLIPKKNPGLLLSAWESAGPKERSGWRLLYVGDGELREKLERDAAAGNAPATFTGFINQSNLDDYYLAADIVVLPSRREGETWGLVVNEALLAGCAVVISAAAGCAVEFAGWERVRVIAEADAGALLARALVELSAQPRDFDWCQPAMKPYSVMSAAIPIAESARQPSL